MANRIVVDKQVYSSKRKALKDLAEGIMACDGSERERYAYALGCIEEGYNVINTYSEIAHRYKTVIDSSQWCKKTGLDRDSTWGLHDVKGNFLFVITDNYYQELFHTGEIYNCFLVFGFDSVRTKEIREEQGIFWTDKMDWYSIFKC